MEIRDIQMTVIEANYDWTIVNVIANEDIVGYRECFFALGATRVIHKLKPLLIGKDGRDIDRLCRLLREAGATCCSGTRHFSPECAIGTIASPYLCATALNFSALEHHGIDVPFLGGIGGGMVRSPETATLN